MRLSACPRARQQGPQQRVRVPIGQFLDQQLRKAGRFGDARALAVHQPGREDNRHRLRAEASSRERQSLHGRAVQPVSIVHHAQQRVVLGHR